MARSGGEESYVNGIPISWPPKQQLCHYCNSTATSLLFCTHHSAFICLNCDAKLHAAAVSDSGHHHSRFPVCQLCERAPAALTCKADAASLCVHCDAEIHNANPLSRRHERVSISPLPAATELADFMVPTVQWMDTKMALCPNQVKTEDIFFPDFIDDLNPLMDVILKQDQTISCCSDGVVPNHHTSNNNNSSIASFEAIDNSFHIDFEKPNFPIYDQQPVAVISSPIQTVQSTSPTVPPAHISTALISDRVTSGRDREARVLRYKEKKKNRKFEKTIRYASRKAYAETRPRIKGRFAKRNNDPDDEFFPDLFFQPDPTFFDDLTDYGVVPSF